MNGLPIEQTDAGARKCLCLSGIADDWMKDIVEHKVIEVELAQSNF